MRAAGRSSLSTNRRVVSETDEKNTRSDQVCVSLTALMTEEVGGAEPSRDTSLTGWFHQRSDGRKGAQVSGKRAKQARRAAAQAPSEPDEPSWSLPPGAQLRVVTEPQALWSIDAAAAALITDHNPPEEMARYRQELRTGLEELFEGEPRPTPALFAVVALNEAGNGLYGAASLEPFLGDELIAQDREAARNVAILHRIIGSLLVVPEARGNGIGNALLDAASLAVVQDQGRYAEGFVDDRDGSAEFYRRAGAYVGGHNEPLPPRPPTNFKTTHYPGKKGHWFFVDSWARHHDMLLCNRCEGAYDFHPENGGILHCSRCQGPGAS